MQKQTDAYFLEGCLRCPLGATERCKVLLWTDTLKALRQLITRTDLQEEMKWGVPVYTWRGKNILSISAL
ncbi:MAG: DUF1801 domain-containing protein, partial [Schleiferiaceae bacterium]|nr:DUF1801 domain-containing protein [Schleiferiaceae bacterium]